MPTFYDGNMPAMTKLVTQGKQAEAITFQGYPCWRDQRIHVHVGEIASTISREEIAALAALFPVDRDCKR